MCFDRIYENSEENIINDHYTDLDGVSAPFFVGNPLEKILFFRYLIISGSWS